MSGAERLYTPELLALAVKLADFPLDDSLPLRGQARSKSCGSTISTGIETNSGGGIARLGMRVQACAVGQATAAIFATQAAGHDIASLERASAQIQHWLGGNGPIPEFPGIEIIEPARAFPGRHGAMMLPWLAAIAALSSAQASG